MIIWRTGYELNSFYPRKMKHSQASLKDISQEELTLVRVLHSI